MYKDDIFLIEDEEEKDFEFVRFSYDKWVIEREADLNTTWIEMTGIMNKEMNWANIFKIQTWMGETPSPEMRIREIGETNFKVLWESPDGELHEEMTKELIIN
jgi:hypothetical protein